jgi:hypothetical protein
MGRVVGLLYLLLIVVVILLVYGGLLYGAWGTNQ